MELITIGEELLLGMVVNTNAAFISKAMMEEGYQVKRHTTLPDDAHILKEGLKEALSRSDIVITTGGLGPTCDDLTRSIAASLFNSDFHHDERVAQDLEKRYGKDLPSLQDQARVPSKAHLFLNAVGTAPGFAFKEGSKILILMPGPPREMETMCTTQVIPYLKQVTPPQEKMHHHLHYLCLLPEVAVDPFLRKLQPLYPQVDMGIYPSLGPLTVRFSSHDEAILKKLDSELKAQFPRNLFHSKTGKIEEAVHDAFIKAKKTLACAESCTGGMIAEKITAIPGASHYFLGSIVAYSDALKKELLNVSDSTLKKHGAVSAETVSEMLQGLFKKTDCDFAIAVTGIAGPTGGTPEKPVGTLWLGIQERGQEPDIKHYLLPRNRSTVIAIASNWLLGTLWQKINL